MRLALGWKVRIGAVAALTLLGAAVVAAPASAEGLSCPRNMFCVWKGPDFTGQFYGSDQFERCWHGITDGQSMANEMQRAVRAYEFSDCTGATFTLEPGFDTATTPFPVNSVRS